MLIVSLYVDDMIYTGNDETMLNDFKASMMKTCEMTDLGMMKFFLGIEVTQNANGIFICQKKYAAEILKRFGMLESKAVCSPIVPGCKLHIDEHGVTIDESFLQASSRKLDVPYGNSSKFDVQC